MADPVTLPTVDVQGTPAEAAPAGVLTFNGKAPIVNPDGSVGMIAPEDMPTALQQGLRPASQAEFDRANWGTGGKAMAAVGGVGRGLTAGFIDPLIIEGARAIGGDKEAEEFRTSMARTKAANEDYAFGGEIAGSLAGMVLMPGAGAAKGALTAEGMLARGGARFLQSAPRAAFEGAAIGLGHQASEDALGNHEATAEKYLAAGVGGFVFGGLLGGGLHAIGGAAADKARTFYGRAAGAAEGAALRSEGAVYRTAANAGEEAETRSPFMSWLRDKVVGGAEDQAFKATGAKIKDIQKLGATAEAQEERVRRIGRRLLDEGIVDATATQEKIAARLTAKVRTAGEDLSAMRGKLDTALERPSTEAIVKRVQSEVLAPLERLPGTQTEANAARAYLEDFAAKAGDRPSFETLHEFRRALDDKLRPKLFDKVPGTAPAGAVELGKIRGIIEDEFTTAGERAAKELGGTFSAEYKLAKQAYSDLKTAEKIVTKEVARGNSNRTWSLTDTIAAGAGFVGAGPVGLAAAVANKGIRTFGNQAAADALNRISRLQMLQRASAQVDKEITAGVRGFMTGEKAAVRAASPKVGAETVAAVREATRDPGAMTAKITEALGGRGLNEAAPRTAQFAATTAMRIGAYLRDIAPKDPAPTGVSFVPQRPRAASATESARFANAVAVANDPMTVVEDLRHGRLNREKVETLKACYPRLYDAVRAEVASQAAELRPDLSQQQQIALSVLFDTPVSAIMQPKNISAFNKSFAQGAEPSTTAQASEQQPMQTGRGLNRKGTLASGFDSLEAPNGK